MGGNIKIGVYYGWLSFFPLFSFLFSLFTRFSSFLFLFLLLLLLLLFPLSLSSSSSTTIPLLAITCLLPLKKKGASG